MVDITAGDVRSALDADPSDEGMSDAALAFEINQAETLVEDEVAPYTDASNARLELVATLLAAAYVEDDGSGPIRSISQGSAELTYAPESGRALTYWQRAVQMDPSGRLALIDKPAASLSVPDVR